MRSQRDGKCLLGCLGLIALLSVVCFIGLISEIARKRSEPAITAPVATTAPVVLSPHLQRLADLRKKQESLKSSIEFELYFARSLARDALKMSMDPLADPGDRQDIMERMDKQKQKLAQLVEDKKVIDADIAQAQLESSEPAPPATGPGTSGDRVTPDPPTSDKEPAQDNGH